MRLSILEQALIERVERGEDPAEAARAVGFAPENTHALLHKLRVQIRTATPSKSVEEQLQRDRQEALDLLAPVLRELPRLARMSGARGQITPHARITWSREAGLMITISDQAPARDRARELAESLPDR